MKQHELVIEVMRQNEGFATLGFLNQNVDVSKWKSKTPFASIRRIVQDERFFFRIEPGLWALKEYEEQIRKRFDIKSGQVRNIDFTHAYYQGLLIEIGNLKGYNTYIPAQDKNKFFLNQSLSSISSLGEIFEFTYPEIMKRAKTVDVIWFNERNLPNSFFEVEHTTDIQNSLLKYNDLQDFYSSFYILSPKERKREFEQKINYSAFKNIKDRVKFIGYEYISSLHAKSFELNKLPQLL